MVEMQTLWPNNSYFKPPNVITENVVTLVNVIKLAWIEQVPNNYYSGQRLMWSKPHLYDGLNAKPVSNN